MNRSRHPIALVLTLICLLPQYAGAWGHDGHKIVAQSGSEISGVTFFTANSSTMADLSNVPDMRWKQPQTADLEKPTHFYQPDAYVSSPSQYSTIPRGYDASVAKYTKAFVEENGTSLWRIQQFEDLAVQAVKAGNWKQALQMAGVMSHYIGDNSQPLHVTSDYDGQSTGQNGIHKFYETTNVKANDPVEIAKLVKAKAKALLATQLYQQMANMPLNEVVFAGIERSYTFKAKVLDIDRRYGRNGRGAQMMLEQAIDRMADGAATLAIVLQKIWDEAGSPTYGASIQVAFPTFVAPSYSKYYTSHFGDDDDHDHAATIDWLDDDCGP